METGTKKQIREKINALNPKIIFTEEEFEQFLAKVKISEGDMILIEKLSSALLSILDSLTWFKNANQVIAKDRENSIPNASIKALLRTINSAEGYITENFKAIQSEPNFLIMNNQLLTFYNKYATKIHSKTAPEEVMEIIKKELLDKFDIPALNSSLSDIEKLINDIGGVLGCYNNFNLRYMTKTIPDLYLMRRCVSFKNYKDFLKYFSSDS